MMPVGMLVLAMAAATGGALDGAAGGGFYVNLLNLQWWQALLGIAIGLGLSPAPWITALATGRLLFRADMERQLADKDAEHARAIAQIRESYEALRALDKERYSELSASNKANAEAAQSERRRSDDVTDALLGVGDVLRANVHAMTAMRGAAETIREEGA